MAANLESKPPSVKKPGLAGCDANPGMDSHARNENYSL